MVDDDEWIKYITKGDILYNNMINYFKKMFDNDKIRNFEVTNSFLRNIADAEMITDEYGEDIQRKLIPWIKNELKENRLFDKTLWNTFRDQNWITHIYLGYRNLFQYNNYYLQLALEEYYEFNGGPSCNEICVRFSLALYGWKDNISDMLQPKNKVKVPYNNIIDDYYWNMK